MANLKPPILDDPEFDSWLINATELIEENRSFLFSTIDLSTWSITEDENGDIIFNKEGVGKMKLDSSGNLTITGTLTQSGTI